MERMMAQVELLQKAFELRKRLEELSNGTLEQKTVYWDCERLRWHLTTYINMLSEDLARENGMEVIFDEG